jgi:predicted polyphosphate/ATP-dependent NAD kinase
MARIGFLINPIAGMGGRVGLKGTDDVAEEAVRRGAVPIAPARAIEALEALKRRLAADPRAPAVAWLTCAGAMGADALRAAGFDSVEIVHHPSARSDARDTAAAVAAFIARGVDLVLFCGGDGTARDVGAVTGHATPILGIPSGVKMYSGVFGVTPARTAEILAEYFAGECGLATADILDLDEEKYRADEWAVRLHMTATTPFEPSLLQAGKALISGHDDEAVKHDIADHLREEIEASPDTLFLLGPGSTVEAVGRALGVDKTLLGIDAIAHGRAVGRDLDEKQILDLLHAYPRCKLVLSPIGAQGFVLGRGNQQLSPAVVGTIGVNNLILVATPAKLARTPVLRFDTGDGALDARLISLRYLPVVVGYRRIRMVKTAD